MSPKGQERVALHATLKRCDLVRRVNPGPRQKHQFLVKRFSQFPLQPTAFYFLSLSCLLPRLLWTRLAYGLRAIVVDP